MQTAASGEEVGKEKERNYLFVRADVHVHADITIQIYPIYIERSDREQNTKIAQTMQFDNETKEEQSNAPAWVEDRVDGVVVLGVGWQAVVQLLGLRADAADAVPEDGVGVVVGLGVDEGVARRVDVGGAGGDGEDVSDVVGAALGDVDEVLGVGLVRVDDGAAIVALLVARDFVVRAVETDVARQEAAESIVLLAVAHIFGDEAGNELLDGLQRQRTAIRRRAGIILSAQPPEGVLDRTPRWPLAPAR